MRLSMIFEPVLGSGKAVSEEWTFKAAPQLEQNFASDLLSEKLQFGHFIVV